MVKDTLFVSHLQLAVPLIYPVQDIGYLKQTHFLLFQSDISDVNQIFKDLGAMVHDQSEVIDSIEASVEKTVVSVGEGASQLRQASTYQVAKLYIVYRLSLEYHYATSYFVAFFTLPHNSCSFFPPKKNTDLHVYPIFG